MKETNKRRLFSVDLPPDMHEMMESIQEKAFVQYRMWPSKNRIIRDALDNFEPDDFLDRFVKGNKK